VFQPPTSSAQPRPSTSLAAAAGGLANRRRQKSLAGPRSVTPSTPLDKRTFVAKVVGHSMETLIPDGSWALFRLFPGGAAPAATALDGRRVVVQLREAADPEHGGSYTLKRWHVVKLASDGGVEEVELRPDNPDFKPMRMRVLTGRSE